MITPNEYKNKVLGKTIDMDGYYGGQCFDLYAHYMKTLGYKYANCTDSGYVKDIWNNRKRNGMLTYCDIVSVKDLQDGDIVVWGECNQCPLSHIAIFRKWVGNNILVLGQNQPVQSVNEREFSTNGIIGCFRPKCYVNKCPFKESGAVKALYDGIRVRTSASLNKGDTGIVYNKGDVLYYNSVVKADGWYWAKYKRNSGGTGYCALCTADGKTKYWKQV